MNKKQKKIRLAWLIFSFIIGLGRSAFEYFSQVNKVYDPYAFIWVAVVVFVGTFIYFLIILGIPAVILYWIFRDKAKKSD